MLRLDASSTAADAEKLCEEILANNPRNPTALASLGVIKFRKREIRDSELLLRAAMSFDRYSSASVKLASILIYIGEYEEAKDLLHKNIDNDSDDAASYLELGRLYLEMHNTIDSVRYIRRSLLIEPNNTSAINALAIALMQSGDYQEASKILKDGIKRVSDSERHQLHVTLEQVMLQNADNAEEQSSYIEALAHVNTAIQSNATAAEAYFLQGFIRYKLGSSREAIKSFRKFVELTKEQPETDIRRAEAERNLTELRKLRSKERTQSISFMTGAVALVSIAVIQLAAVWFLFLTKQIPESSMLIIVSMSIGLLVIALLLPHLSKLKFLGVEAEVSKPVPTISPGPSTAVIQGVSIDVHRLSLAIGSR